MNWKNFIQNLKIPRLLVEAALIFASVYFALILEADRSKDFERELLIEELETFSQAVVEDSIFLCDIYYDSIVWGEEDGIQVIVKGFTELERQTGRKYLEKLNTEDFDQISDMLEAYYFLWGTSLDPIMSDLEFIKENHWSLISKQTKDSINNYFSWIVSHDQTQEEIFNARASFQNKIDESILYQGKREDLNRKIEFLLSPISYNFFTNSTRFLGQAKYQGNGALKLIPGLRKQIKSEIILQKELTEGIN